ncbi:MAG: hypothetical protein ABF654_00505 [Gluconobacter potus]|uniref:hypothetical protein n=1 Tax=Gluconobacter potus TaxID=2724927 RepID=UPI0039E7907C
MKFIHAVIRKLRPRARHPDDVRGNGPPREITISGVTSYAAFKLIEQECRVLKVARNSVNWTNFEEQNYIELTRALDELSSEIFPPSPFSRFRPRRGSVWLLTTSVRPKRS